MRSTRGEHLAVQAGTGTGKSLAYLVPAIARAVATDEPVVVSTATIALQRQLVDRDLPALADSLAGALPRRPKFALLKGRGNYLCLNKIHNGSAAEPDDRPQEELFDAAATTALGRDVQRLIAWSSTTETGDRDELTPGVPDRSWGTGQRLGAGNASARPAARSAPTASRRRRAIPRGTPMWSSPTTRCWPSTPSPTPRCCPNTDCSSSTRHTSWWTG